ncbi:hypothetical protein KCU90_g3504, partial [Aureobasidium melanogenum]
MNTQQNGTRDLFQFYPTPPDLATRVWSKLNNKHPDRVLEPSAGKGHLLKGMHDRRHSYGTQSYAHVDCCEIDVRHHSDLRELGVKIVGHDFLAMQSGACYSAIVGNPPFHNGEKHVLKAWDLLWDGEVVMIINAETVRKPLSAERKRLVKLIDDFGDVEFVEGAFEVDDAERRTPVDVAIVHLVKKADVGSFVTMDLLRGMQRDTVSNEELGRGYAEPQQLALPANEIENRVLIFDAAVESARAAIFAEAQASAYAGMLGESIGPRSPGQSDRVVAPKVELVRAALGKAYGDLKGRAWASVFTVENIYSFLIGICEQQGKIQIDMLCDTFDRITRYHSDNTAYYRGWRSNDKHYRSIGRRIRYTRFIIPGFTADTWNRSAPWEMQSLLADFDKGFALLAGDTAPAVSLVSACNSCWTELKHGARVESSYFDIRYYPGMGTIHFFPRDKKLIDRLNRVVGRHRGWLPAENLKLESAGFWDQYEKAEKLDKEIRKAVAKGGIRSYDDPFRSIDHESWDGHEQACERIDQAMKEVHEANGIQVEFRLASEQSKDASAATQHQLPLLAAA